MVFGIVGCALKIACDGLNLEIGKKSIRYSMSVVVCLARGDVHEEAEERRSKTILSGTVHVVVHK